MVILPFMMIIILGYGWLLERKRADVATRKLKEMKMLMSLANRRRR